MLCHRWCTVVLIRVQLIAAVVSWRRLSAIAHVAGEQMVRHAPNFREAVIRACLTIPSVTSLPFIVRPARQTC